MTNETVAPESAPPESAAPESAALSVSRPTPRFHEEPEERELMARLWPHATRWYPPVTQGQYMRAVEKWREREDAHSSLVAKLMRGWRDVQSEAETLSALAEEATVARNISREYAVNRLGVHDEYGINPDVRGRALQLRSQFHACQLAGSTTEQRLELLHTFQQLNGGARLNVRLAHLLGRELSVLTTALLDQQAQANFKHGELQLITSLRLSVPICAGFAIDDASGWAAIWAAGAELDRWRDASGRPVRDRLSLWPVMLNFALPTLVISSRLGSLNRLDPDKDLEEFKSGLEGQTLTAFEQAYRQIAQSINAMTGPQLSGFKRMIAAGQLTPEPHPSRRRAASGQNA